MNPELAHLIYLLGVSVLAVVVIVIGARLNTDLDEPEQERVEREHLPIMLRKQAD